MAKSTPIIPPKWVLLKIRNYLHYNPETGRLTWIKTDSSKVKIGDEAGYINSQNYIIVTLTKKSTRKLIKAHHIAWYKMTGEWPNYSIDHRDGNGSNNKWNNLRKTRDQNNQNHKMHKTNTSGVNGVCWDKSKNMFLARIWYKNRCTHLGYFNRLSDAETCRLKYEKLYHGEFGAALRPK